MIPLWLAISILLLASPSLAGRLRVPEIRISTPTVSMITPDIKFIAASGKLTPGTKNKYVVLTRPILDPKEAKPGETVYRVVPIELKADKYFPLKINLEEDDDGDGLIEPILAPDHPAYKGILMNHPASLGDK